MSETTNKSTLLSRLLIKMGAKIDEPLAKYSPLKVGGPASFFVTANTVEQIRQIVAAARDFATPIHILSGGSNTLFSDHGFMGIVLKLGKGFDYIEPETNGLSIKVGSAVSYAKITKLAIAAGWSQAVGWCGTPGLIGGAIKMNAGTRMGEIKDAIGLIHGVKDKELLTLTKDDISFGYRSNDLPDDLIICEAQLVYDQAKLESPQQLQERARSYQEQRRRSQPSTNSLGSFFKNPYPAYAGQLIEKCHLKGLTYKGAQFSPLHANFIVNNGGATAYDILHLASMAQQKVFDTYQIVLHPEIRMVGHFATEHLLCPKKFLPIQETK